MPVIPTILDIAKHREEKKRREKWDPLLEKEQKLMNLAKQLEIGKERQLAKMWEPGGPRTQQPISAPIAGAPTFGYQVPEGMLHKYKRLETEYMRSPEQEQELELTGERRKKELGEEFRDYEDTMNVYGIEIPLFKRDPATGEYIRRTTEELEQIARTELESDLQRQLKAIRLGLSDRDKEEEMEGGFDKNGRFDPRNFFEIANQLPEYAGYTLYDLVNKEGIEKARNKILKMALAAYGDTPEHRAEIQRAMDEWINTLFDMSQTDPGATLGTMAENIARTKEKGISPRGFSRAEILEGARERYGSAFQKIKEAFNRGKSSPELITPGPTTEGYADEKTEKESKLKGLGKKLKEKLKFWK